MTVSKSENLFHVLAQHVAVNDLSELYLIAGPVEFDWFKYDYANNGEVERALAGATETYGRGNVWTALIAHYAAMSAAQQSTPTLLHGSRGLIQCGNVAVEFSVAEIGIPGRKVFRVLFQRVDAVALYLGLADRVAALEKNAGSSAQI